ncbi:MAG TPA: cation diffusion facilitator family transporter [Longimicrobiales bacterium]|nr:cation diffusion facilitator family transporter [Longimicrobiales bacterium]
MHGPRKHDAAPGHRHDPGHDHDHGHDHHDHDHHDHLREVSRRRLIVVLALTSTFMVVEFVGGWIANSLALMADAGHMLNDVAALALTWFALWFSRRPATPEKTYGWLRLEILCALVNGAALFLIAGIILWQAFLRFQTPQEVEGTLMLVVASGGLVVNIIGAVLLHSSASHNLNMRGAYLHILGDLLGSVGAISAALIILATGWYVADPLISVFVALLILAGAWRLMRESVDILLEAVPRGIDIGAVHRAILDVDGVHDVYDLHVWTLTSGYLSMSGHALIRDPARHQSVLQEIHDVMHSRFNISHVTVQIDHETLVPLTRTQPDRAGARRTNNGAGRDEDARA